LSARRRLAKAISSHRSQLRLPEPSPRSGTAESGDADRRVAGQCQTGKPWPKVQTISAAGGQIAAQNSASAGEVDWANVTCSYTALMNDVAYHVPPNPAASRMSPISQRRKRLNGSKRAVLHGVAIEAGRREWW
jgi:hypothetical protein